MFIQFHIKSHYFILLLIYPMFYQISLRISQSNNGCYELFLNYLSYLFIGVKALILIINRYIENRKINSFKEIEEPTYFRQMELYEDPIEEEIKRERKELIKRRSRKKKLLLISLAFISLIQMSLEIIVNNALKNVLDYKIKECSAIFAEVLFFVLLSKIILHYEIYNHQIFALIIISISMIFIFASYIIENSLNFDKIMNFVFFSLIFALYALYYVLGKYALRSFIPTPYFLMFAIGLINLIILLPYEIISYLINPNWEFNGVIRQIKYNFSFVFFLEMILNVTVRIFWLGGIWMTVYYYDPCNLIISESISKLLTILIENRFKDYDLTTKIICYISYGIIILSSLIYNGNIIINCKNLSRDIYFLGYFKEAGKDITKDEIYEKCFICPFGH